MKLLIESLKNDTSSDIYIDIEYLKENDVWVPSNGNMLFHLLNTNGVHIDGYYFMGMGNEGLRIIGMVKDRSIDERYWFDLSDGMLKIDGVDLI